MLQTFHELLQVTDLSHPEENQIDLNLIDPPPANKL